MSKIQVVGAALVFAFVLYVGHGIGATAERIQAAHAARLAQ